REAVAARDSVARKSRRQGREPADERKDGAVLGRTAWRQPVHVDEVRGNPRVERFSNERQPARHRAHEPEWYRRRVRTQQIANAPRPAFAPETAVQFLRVACRLGAADVSRARSKQDRRDNADGREDAGADLKHVAPAGTAREKRAENV